MDLIIRTGFQKIKHRIDFQPITPKKGEDLCKSGHVFDVQELRKNGISNAIEARVIRQTSVSETPYSVVLFVSKFIVSHLILF